MEKQDHEDRHPLPPKKRRAADRERSDEGFIYIAHAKWMGILKIGTYTGDFCCLVRKHEEFYGPTVKIYTFFSKQLSKDEADLCEFLENYQHGEGLFCADCLHMAKSWLCGRIGKVTARLN